MVPRGGAFSVVSSVVRNKLSAWKTLRRTRLWDVDGNAGKKVLVSTIMQEDGRYIFL